MVNPKYKPLKSKCPKTNYVTVTSATAYAAFLVTTYPEQYSCPQLDVKVKNIYQ